jgi:hypothetical protein
MERCMLVIVLHPPNTKLVSHLATTTLEPRLVPRHKQTVLRSNRDITQGQPCKVSILKDGSAQRKAVMTRNVPQSRECLPVSNLGSPLNIRSGLQGGAWHLLHSI